MSTASLCALANIERQYFPGTDRHPKQGCLVAHCREELLMRCDGEGCTAAYCGLHFGKLAPTKQGRLCITCLNLRAKAKEAA